MKIGNIVFSVSEHIAPDLSQAVDGAELITINPRDAANVPPDPFGPMFRDLLWSEAALRAEDIGCEAAIINSVCDYGLPLARSAVTIPVIGCGQAGVMAAIEQRRKFAIVTVWPASTRKWYDRILDTYGVRDHCVSMRFVLDGAQMAIDNPIQTHMKSVEQQGSDLAAEVLRACQDSVKTDGAEAIILGCTCMVGLTDYLQSNVDALIIDPLREAYRAAEKAAMAARGQPQPVRDCSDQSLHRIRALGQALADQGVSLEAECGDVCGLLGRAA